MKRTIMLLGCVIVLMVSSITVVKAEDHISVANGAVHNYSTQGKNYIRDDKKKAGAQTTYSQTNCPTTVWFSATMTWYDPTTGTIPGVDYNIYKGGSGSYWAADYYELNHTGEANHYFYRVVSNHSTTWGNETWSYNGLTTIYP